MQTTTNYELKKIELTDSPPDITVLSPNFDTIDTQLKSNSDAAAAAIPKSLATAVSQFLVSSAAGTWVIKTVAEIKTLLGLGSAAYTASTAYATAAQGTKADNAVSDLALHQADTMYQVAGGTATAITLTISESLVDGFPVTFIASANNNGSATIINNKPLYKPNTTTAPTLVAGKAYTVWYNVATPCFFIKASAEGTAVAGNVLAGETFSNDNDTGLTGTMTNQGAKIITPSTVNQAIVAGYHNGSGYIQGDADLIAGNILSGKNIFGVAGIFKNIKSIQRGVNTAINWESGGVRDVIIPINPVDPSKSVLLFTFIGSSFSIRGQLLNSTSLEFDTNPDSIGSGTATIYWTVIEFECGVTVQRGITCTGSTAFHTTVSASVIANSFVTYNAWANNADSRYWIGIGYLSNTTTLYLNAIGAYTRYLAWQLVTFN